MIYYPRYVYYHVFPCSYLSSTCIYVPIIIGSERLNGKAARVPMVFAKLHGISLNNIITFETAEIVARPFICKYSELTDATYLRVIIRIQLPITQTFSYKRQLKARAITPRTSITSRALSKRTVKALIRNNYFHEIKQPGCCTRDPSSSRHPSCRRCICKNDN